MTEEDDAQDAPQRVWTGADLLALVEPGFAQAAATEAFDGREGGLRSR